MVGFAGGKRAFLIPIWWKSCVLCHLMSRWKWCQIFTWRANPKTLFNKSICKQWQTITFVGSITEWGWLKGQGRRLEYFIMETIILYWWFMRLYLRWRDRLHVRFFSKQNFSSKTALKPPHTIHFQKAKYLNFIMVALLNLKHERGAVLGLKTSILVLCHKN